MKKRTLLAAAFMALGLGLTGCANSTPKTQTVTVTLDYQDAVVATNSNLNTRSTVTAQKGAVLTLADAENQPYTFGGWFTRPGGVGDKAEDLKPENDLTLYAYWLGTEGLLYEDGKVRRGTVAEDVESIVVAPAYDGVPTDEVAYGAFAGLSSLQSVHLPDTVVKLGDNAFRFCTALQKIRVPSYLRHIGSECFNGVDGLTSFIVPATCDYVGYGAFAACDSLAYVQFRTETAPQTPVDLSYGHAVILVVPNTAVEAFGKAYVGLKNTGNIVPMSSKQGDFLIENGTAYRYIGNAENVTLPETVTSVKENCFYGNKTVKSITIPSHVEKIEQYAFANCDPQLTLNVWFAEDDTPFGFLERWNNNLRDTKYTTVYGGAQ